MKLTVQQIDYNAERHQYLIEKIEPTYDLISELTAKRLLLGEVIAGDNLLGIFIFRIEHLIDSEQDLVICHVVSDKTTTGNFSELTLPFVKQLARQNNIKSIRIHTDNDAVQRLYERAGFKYCETVLKLDIV